MTVAEWLESDYLRCVARRVAYAYHLPASLLPDLYQELCLALWKAGSERTVNATWVFHTANHRAIEMIHREPRTALLTAAETAQLSSTRFPGLEETLLVHARAARLRGPLRSFYRLRFEEGYTQRELAQREQVTRGDVRGMERACLRQLTGRRV